MQSKVNSNLAQRVEIMELKFQILKKSIDKIKAERIENHEDGEQFLSTIQAANYLKITLNYLYQLIYRNAITYHKPAKKVYFKKADLDAYLNRNRVPAKS